MKKNIDIQEKIVPVSTTQKGVPGFVYKDTKTNKIVSGFVPVSKLTADQTSEISKYTQPSGSQGYKLDPGALKQAEPKPAPDKPKPPVAAPDKPKPPVAAPPAPRNDRRTAPPTTPARQTPPQASPVAQYMKAAAAARKSGDPAEMAKVRDMGMEIWRKSNPKLAAAADEKARIRGTAQTDNPLMKDMRDRLPLTPSVQSPTLKKDLGNLASNYTRLTQNPNAAIAAAPKPTIQPVEKSQFSNKATPEMNQSAKNLSDKPLKKPEVKKEAYDIVLDYLLAEGHVDTVDEANYVMLQMSAEHIQNIVIQERAWWDPAGAFTKTPKEKALEKPSRGYDPSRGTTLYGRPETGYKPKVIAPRGGVAGVIEPGKPKSWTPITPSKETESLYRYRTVRGETQLRKDKLANRQARIDAAKLAADERRTPTDEFAAARRNTIVAEPKPRVAPPKVAAPVKSEKPAIPAPAPTPAAPEPRLTKAQQDILDLRQMRADSLSRQGDVAAAQKLQTEVDVARAEKKMPPKEK